MITAVQLNLPLQVGSRLENYRILRVLAAGGFSFVYLAHDENDAPVVIKEYLPATLPLRANGQTAHLSDIERGRFNAGLKCFFEEGRSLAHLAHPNVVRVLNFFRANETVYLVMRYERGRTLQEHIQARRGALEELWVRTTFAQLLNGLREVHSNKLLHLDIKPGNVYVRNDGSPLLIDFGAARQQFSAEGPHAAAELHARLRRARAAHRRGAARPLDRHLRHRRDALRLFRRGRAAAGGRAAKEGRSRAGAQGLEGEIFHAIARHGRLVHEAFTS
jgi:serine/threonine protein kinase